MILLDYRLENHGWATATVSNGEIQKCFDASYLHDTLRNLATSALTIGEVSSTSVIFMQEPGEIQLILELSNKNELEFELRSFKDWASWNFVSDEEFEVLLNGKTSITQYIQEVRELLKNIYEKTGLEQYKTKWIEHEFPVAEYQELERRNSITNE